MTCDRCFQPLSDGDHGEGICPYEPRSAGRAFISDELPGGPRMLENLGHEKVYIRSKSHLQAELKARGLMQKVRHVGVPGSDRSPQTTRWI